MPAKRAVELEKVGEDGSGLLERLCGDFELAQLNAAVAGDHQYRYFVDDALRVAEVMERYGNRQGSADA